TSSPQPGSGPATGSNSPGGPSSGPGTSSGSGTAPNSAAGGAATSARGATPSSSPSASGPVVVPPSAQLAGGTTPRSDVGTIRWVLITVVIIGGAGVLAGTLLRSGRLPRPRRGART